jgi:hypothetical protein
MRTDKRGAYERVSPWMKRCREGESDIFLKLPKNESFPYGVIFAASISLTALVYTGNLEFAGGSRANMVMIFSPLVALFALIKFLWSKYGETELWLGTNLKKTQRCWPAYKSTETWNWLDIQTVWIDKLDAHKVDQTNNSSRKLLLSCNRKIQKLIGNLSFEEAEILHASINSRLVRETST